MQVVCKANSGASLSSRVLAARVASTETEYSIKIGRVCTVHGISVAHGVVHYLVIPSDGAFPVWYPAELFDVTDYSLPGDWYFDYYGTEHGIDAMWGYRELVLDPDHHDDLIGNRGPKAVGVFAERCLRKQPRD